MFVTTSFMLFKYANNHWNKGNPLFKSKWSYGKTGNKNCASCFATLQQNELKSFVAHDNMIKSFDLPWETSASRDTYGTKIKEFKVLLRLIKNHLWVFLDFESIFPKHLPRRIGLKLLFEGEVWFFLLWFFGSTVCHYLLPLLTSVLV